jgi:hypothetical protein
MGLCERTLRANFDYSKVKRLAGSHFGVRFLSLYLLLVLPCVRLIEI